MKRAERKALLNTLFFPILFLLIMWGVKLIEHQFNTLNFTDYGVYPRTLGGLKGILFAPFIHKDLPHLINNSYPILILGSMLFSFYKKIAKQLFFWLFFITGFWLWCIGRGAFHIGASGIVYALASFLLVSGLIRKNPKLSAISMLIIFLYGSMIWGILPTKESISWEGHLSGFLTGILLAIFYKNEGPKRKKYQWEIDEELEQKRNEVNEIKINYSIKEKENSP